MEMQTWCVVQGFETSPSKAARREHHWPGQGEVQGPEVPVTAAAAGPLVGVWPWLEAGVRKRLTNFHL